MVDISTFSLESQVFRVEPVKSKGKPLANPKMSTIKNLKSKYLLMLEGLFADDIFAHFP